MELNLILFSGFLFLIGFIGSLINKSNLIKLLLAIEMMILAAIVNFCFVNFNNTIRVGDIFALVALLNRGLIFCLIFAINLRQKRDE